MGLGSDFDSAALTQLQNTPRRLAVTVCRTVGVSIRPLKDKYTVSQKTHQL